MAPAVKGALVGVALLVAYTVVRTWLDSRYWGKWDL